ncbi:MAG TPA: hypothetical protein DDY14_00805, partial [Chromatiaceae bacterium]|nr:hypothetical protein [Chromatiaceae bacterium]
MPIAYLLEYHPVEPINHHASFARVSPDGLRTCLAKNVYQRQVLFLRGQAMGYPIDLTDAERARIEQHFQ